MAGNIDAGKVRTMLNTQPALEQLRNLPTDTLLYENLSSFLSNPANTSLDVAAKLVIGTQCAGGAYSDVFIGSLLVGDVDDAAIKLVLKNKGRLRKYLKQNPMTFKTVAVKRLRYFLFLTDDGARVSRYPHSAEIFLIYHLNHEVTFTRITRLV